MSGNTLEQSASSVSAAGGLGKMISLRLEVESLQGDPDSRYETHLETRDVVTGIRATLDQLLLPEQYNNLVRMAEFKLGNHADGFLYCDRGDPKLGSSFALYSEGGKNYIEIGLSPYVRPMAGYEARFKFEAPDDAHFRKSVGLDPL